jgi:hypothetical protein
LHDNLLLNRQARRPFRKHLQTRMLAMTKAVVLAVSTFDAAKITCFYLCHLRQVVQSRLDT